MFLFRTGSGQIYEERKSMTGTFAGYNVDGPSFNIFLDGSEKIVSSSNVIFDEDPKERGSFAQILLPMDELKRTQKDQEFVNTLLINSQFLKTIMSLMRLKV